MCLEKPVFSALSYDGSQLQYFSFRCSSFDHPCTLVWDSNLGTSNTSTRSSPLDRARSDTTVRLPFAMDVLTDVVLPLHCSRSFLILQATSFTYGAPLLLSWPGGDESS